MIILGDTMENKKGRGSFCECKQKRVIVKTADEFGVCCICKRCGKAIIDSRAYYVDKIKKYDA